MLRRVPLVLALAFAAACSSPMEGTQTADFARDGNSAALELTLAASPAEISPGDTILLRATLRNRSPQPVTIHFSSGCQILVYVEDLSGRMVHPSGGGWGCTAALTQLTVPANGSVTRTDGWSGTGVPAGSYRAYAHLQGVVDGGVVQLRSERVTLRVR